MSTFNSDSLFEAASRKKLRFNYRGQCSVEDLWVLSLESLDEIYKGIMRQIKAASEDSLLAQAQTEATSTLNLQADLIRHIVKTRQEEQAVAATKQANAQKRQKLLEILASKEDAALQNLSQEEILAQLEAL